eukprot:m.171960 g.171960  ORF g.171960 m.171960 type:complete len:140 (+) comp14566_c0_seq1:798-1217(+)
MEYLDGHLVSSGTRPPSASPTQTSPGPIMSAPATIAVTVRGSEQQQQEEHALVASPTDSDADFLELLEELHMNQSRLEHHAQAVDRGLESQDGRSLKWSPAVKSLRSNSPLSFSSDIPCETRKYIAHPELTVTFKPAIQ